MTAAHCCEGADSISGTAGDHSIANFDPTEETKYSDNIILHENWNGFTIDNDICVVHMARSYDVGK